MGTQGGTLAVWLTTLAAAGCLAGPVLAGEAGDDEIAKRLKELKAKKAAEDSPAAPLAAGTVLDTRSLWRFRTVRETPEVVGPDGSVVHGRVVLVEKDARGWFGRNPDKGTLPDEKFRIEPVAADKVRTLPSDTPAGWMKPDFDDGAWARMRGPMFGGFFSEDDDWKLILMRGRFEAADPAKAGDLSLSMAFRGGAVVYLNGEEVHRAFMPKGEATLAAAAEPYPPSAHFTADGFVIHWNKQTTAGERERNPQDIKDRVAGRTRRIEGVKIPGAKLRKGANVLAIAIHRAPTPAEFFVGRTRGDSRVHPGEYWTKLGLVSVSLLSPPGSSAVPNVGPASAAGFAIWNHNSAQKVSVADYPEPLAPLRPVRISGARNGSFGGQVVAGDGRPIRGLKAAASDLRGPGTIPASAVTVRYGMPDAEGGAFDSLEDFPPAEVPVHAASNRAVQPLWISVTVPADAKPGEYSGAVTVSAEGVPATAVPLEVRVAGWNLPPPSEFTGCLDLVQSPESVAMAYGVPLWSEEHFRLLDRTFALLGALGNKTLFISCIRRTHFGNEHAMVRWVRDKDDELRPDFSVAERYLDTAMKHMGRIPGVIFLCWEPPYSQGHALAAGTAQRTYDKSILYSLYDPETKEYSPRQGPAWGTPEAKEFWKKLTDGIGPVLEKRGLKGSLLFGLAGDARPTKQAMDDICNAVPGAKWAIHSHYYCEKWQGYEMAMRIALWGLGYSPEDPDRGLSFGWSNPQWVSYYPREMEVDSTLTEYRCKLEAYMGARRYQAPALARGEGPRGLGRLGADFWPVLKDERGQARATLAGRYPESAWGQLNLNYGVPRVLGRGKNGAVPTIRSEAFREAQQELEARVFVEKALLDAAGPELLGEDLIRRCRTALDERIRIANCAAATADAESWYISSGWRDRAELLFGLAAEVKARYGDKSPVPNLTPAPEPARKK